MNRLFQFLGKKIHVQIAVWVILILPFAAYLIWEGYWYTKVGLRVIKWHTHCVEYIYVWIAGVFIFQLLSRKPYTERAKNLFLLFTSVVGILGALEIYLQLSGTYKTYMEKCSGDYTSVYETSDKKYYHTWGPNQPHFLTKPEFSYWRPTNSLGYGDREWSLEKKPKEKRLLALGDSFTEGDGTPYDSSYVALLNKKLLATGDTFYVMNAGVCGSDPFYNYVELRDYLANYKPDVIIQALATNDITTDILVRGGMERFQKDGTQKYTPAPWWEPVYALSYIGRIFFRLAGYNELLLNKGITPQKEDELNKKVIDLFKQYSALCKQKHIKLYVVLRPDKGEVVDNKYCYNFSDIMQHLNADTNVHVLDLMNPYRAYIAQRHTNALDYYWKQDGHHNPKGYEMMAQCTYNFLSASNIDSLVANENKSE